MKSHPKHMGHVARDLQQQSLKMCKSHNNALISRCVNLKISQ